MTDTAAPASRRLLVEPDISGPRVRLGVLWFLLALAAVTSGRLWTSLLCGFVAALTASQIVDVWGRPRARRRQRSGSRDVHENAEAAAADRLMAALVSGLLPLLAGYSTGAVGAGLIAAPVVIVALHTFRRGSFATALPTLIGALLPALATVSIVLTVRLNLWAGLFMVMAVSMYDAGSFLLGAESASRWEGPVAGMIGVLAITFTMGVFHPNPFTPVSVAVCGLVVAATCPLGQMVASKFLPYPDAKARGLRRLDAYLVAGPAFYVCSLLIVR